MAVLVRDRQIPLEVCPTSNLHTLGITAAEHPLGALREHGFNLTLSTDNRLMSRVTLTDEFAFAAEHHGFTMGDLRRATVAALEAAFVDQTTRRQLLGLVAEAYPS